MRNHNYDGSLIIPDHLQPKWRAINQELRDASTERDEAEKRYSEAILNRLESPILHESSSEWEEICGQLQAARKRYHQAIVARVAITQEINSPWPLSA